MTHLPAIVMSMVSGLALQEENFTKTHENYTFISRDWQVVAKLEPPSEPSLS